MTTKPAGACLMALMCAACLVHEARATRANDMPPPTEQAVRRAASAAMPTASAEAERQRLREGVVDGLDLDHGRVRIDGVWLQIVEGRTRMIRLGRAADTTVVSVGQRLRFTLASDAAATATLGLVYVP